MMPLTAPSAPTQVVSAAATSIYPSVGAVPCIWCLVIGPHPACFAESVLVDVDNSLVRIVKLAAVQSAPIGASSEGSHAREGVARVVVECRWM